MGFRLRSHFDSSVASNAGVQELVEWGKSLKLAPEEDPNETA